MPKFVIVDGYSLLFRAFFAMPYLSNSQGEPTGAVHGFANMLVRLLNEENPDAMLVAWDAPGEVFRTTAYSDYKANRPSAPDEFKSQVRPARDLVRALGLKPLELTGFEADDCIGTAAVHAEEEGYEVLIVSGDTDMLQLVRPRVRVMIPKKGVSEVATYDESAVEERYGIRPDQMVDYKALKGDTSDNIPGVKGIGEKTAAALIREWGSLDNLYVHLDEVKPERVRKLLEDGRESARLSYDLSRIHCDAPCAIDPEGYHVAPPDIEAVRDLFNRMEFRTLLQRVEERYRAATGDRGPEAGTPATPSLWDAAEQPEMQEASLASLEADLHRARSNPPLALVAQTEGPSPIRTELAGLAWATADGCASLAVDEAQDLPPALAQALGDPDLSKVIYDAKPLLHALNPKGIALEGVVLDVMLAGYLLHAGRFNISLDTLAVDTLGRNLPPKPTGKAAAEEERVRERLGAEVCAVREMAPLLHESLQSTGLWDLYAEMEAPLVPILAAMERRGVLLDPDALKASSEFLASRIAELEEQAYEMAGERFNIGSPKQLQVLLFEKLGLPRGKKTKTGYSTGVEVLEELAGDFPLVGLILEWREVSKLRSTYTEALLRLMDPDTCRIHTTFNQAVAATGRLSSAEPNLQNIPVRTEAGREIRRAFVAPPGHRLLSADYSQIELRILAHYTGEPALVRAFAEDEDIHAATARLLFGVGPDGVTSDMRRRAKTVNFAVLYGQSDFGLSKELSIPVAEAREFIQAYFARFPGIQGYLDATLAQARKEGYVTTLLGRRRWFPDIHSPNRNARLFAERAAVNSPIQGTAADLIKRAMIEVTRRLEAEGHPARLLLQVHDELLFEVPEGAVESAAKWVREAMEGALALRVPVRVDVKAGSNWKEMDPVG
ncbi:MAG: DNA polymerase I [Armatimonadetes bacterium]|nr:DNA polymerase I [Armatimonadota bacterium]